ncbi:uncharacterized protein LOC125943441 [Dermacentor silvarum]|uniref:uncharacterized protein LOC125943441 n=1 Tax=Dermacentor silvarum TaxID=543639 RepID=UPI0021007EFD|nr:uncharacterized protein LOC125943441 [Dermacentor silvarum]
MRRRKTSLIPSSTHPTLTVKENWDGAKGSGNVRCVFEMARTTAAQTTVTVMNMSNQGHRHHLNHYPQGGMSQPKQSRLTSFRTVQISGTVRLSRRLHNQVHRPLHCTDQHLRLSREGSISKYKCLNQHTGQYPHLLLKLQGHTRIRMCSVLCTGRKLPAHSQNCKLVAHRIYQYLHPLLELQGHTRNHTYLMLYAGLLRHMLKLPALQSCNLLVCHACNINFCWFCSPNPIFAFGHLMHYSQAEHNLWCRLYSHSSYRPVSTRVTGTTKLHADPQVLASAYRGQT